MKSAEVEKKTLWKEEMENVEYRYYTSNLSKDIELFSRAVRSHWAVERMQIQRWIRQRRRTRISSGNGV